MKILVISDTHDKLSKVRDIWPKLNNIDLVIHAGDFYLDAKELEQELNVPFVYVRGNCDGSYSGDNCDPKGGDFAVVDTPAGRILVTHGHNEGVNFSFDKLRYKALENDCFAAVFGHTHKAMVEQTEDPSASGGFLWYINPGSLSLPRDRSGGSYAIIRATEERFDATVIYYNTVMGSSRGGSSFGGHGGSGGNADDKTEGQSISSLLNYVDRF
ncbi:MAG: metallophosphoesterase [Eubacteriales bacterium]|nr:metallophosphoesterase [Eubacteriales bacterium]